MDRSFVYPGQVPADTHILFPQQAGVIALGMLVKAAIGTGMVFDGLSVGPTAPASMSVAVGAGSLYALNVVDSAGYGSLGTNAAPLVKQAVNLAAMTVGPLAAPATAGQSVNVLIEAALSEVDGSPVLLPYMNAANPSVPYGGVGNNGVSQPTRRTVSVALQAKPGTPAPTGSQTTPATDANYVPVAVVTIACGQSSIAAGNIATVTTYSLLSKLGNVLQGTASLTDASSALTTSAWVQALLAGKAPMPAASGVGQWTTVPVVPGTGGYVSLPAGGTWAWFWYNGGPSGTNQGQGLAGISAGGTTLVTASGTIAGNIDNCSGFCWRIA